ncbi:3508_t:CDS:2, partial [Scutellospora calospora]
KTKIYKVLDKQPVYAVGPDIQQRYSMPCLACWATKPFDISTMKKLLVLFDNEFEIINYVNRNGANNILSSKNNSNQNEQGNKNGRNRNNGDQNDGDRKDYEKNRDINDGNENKDSKNSGGDRNEENGNGGDDYDDGGGDKDGNTYIQVSSIAKAKLEKEFQKFGIDLFNCGVDQMLNEICKLSHGFVSYYIDSIEIGVSLLFSKSDISQLFMLKKAYNPQNINQENIKLSAGHEQTSATIRIGKVLTSGTKCKRAAISDVTKCEICQKLSAPNPPKQKDLALEYNISEQAVSDI